MRRSEYVHYSSQNLRDPRNLELEYYSGYTVGQLLFKCQLGNACVRRFVARLCHALTLIICNSNVI